MTMIIAIPTGVKIFNWLFTIYRGRLEFTTPVLWTIGFMVTFTIGGMTGVMMAIPGADFVLHNSLFLVAHFHNTIIGGVVFGYLAGLHYWFPKAFGFKLNEKLGKARVLVLVRRLLCRVHAALRARLHGHDATHESLRQSGMAAVAAWSLRSVLVLIAIGVAHQVRRCASACADRNLPEYRDVTGDPWDGRTLEWATSSPPPVYNFANLPVVHELDAFAHMKETRPRARTEAGVSRHSHAVEHERGFFRRRCSAWCWASRAIWHIWWLAIAALVGALPRP